MVPVACAVERAVEAEAQAPLIYWRAAVGDARDDWLVDYVVAGRLYFRWVVILEKLMALLPRWSRDRSPECNRVVGIGRRGQGTMNN